MISGLVGSLSMGNLSPVLVGGEALFDLISRAVGSGLGSSRNFEKRPGGSPFNIVVGIQRLGIPVAFVGKFGVDQFGEALVDFLKNESIDVTHIVRGPGTKTTVAFVAVDKEGKPEFRFYRDRAADIALREEELIKVQPGVFSIFHFGGTVLAEEPSASAYAWLQLAGKSIANLAAMGSAELASVMRVVNAAAAIVATRVGAAEANPTRKEVEQFLAEHREA
jgi:sugar/nucleoside kinase (ribokinase family)